MLLFFARMFFINRFKCCSFKKCMIETKNFHWVVFIISLINFFTAIFIFIIYRNCEEKENNLLKNIFNN